MKKEPTEEQEKGWRTEEKFRQMLSDQGIPYLPFCDNVKKFSSALGYFGTKRPDIMILLRHVGYLLVDVKHKKKSAKGYESFLLSSGEVEKYAKFHKEFGHEVWFVTSSEEENYKHWHWIPATEVMNCKKIDVSNGEQCYVIPTNYCITVQSDGAFSQLFTALFFKAQKQNE